MNNDLIKFELACRKKGLKVTHQRMEVFKAVNRATSHPSVDDIYKIVRRKLPTISLDTIYRTVTTLEEMGVITSFRGPAGRMRYDTNLDRHQHLICSECNTIEDIHWRELEKLRLPDSPQWSQLELASVELRGICARCRAKRGT